jgi:hypothetical protein
MALRSIPEILNTVDMVLLVCKQFRVIDLEVMKIGYVQHVACSPTV